MTSGKVHIAHSVYGPTGPQTVCGHAINPGINPLKTATDPKKVTCRNCKTSWRRPR